MTTLLLFCEASKGKLFLLVFSESVKNVFQIVVQLQSNSNELISLVFFPYLLEFAATSKQELI
jgi:hypothetical protein